MDQSRVQTHRRVSAQSMTDSNLLMQDYRIVVQAKQIDMKCNGLPLAPF